MIFRHSFYRISGTTEPIHGRLIVGNPEDLNCANMTSDDFRQSEGLEVSEDGSDVGKTVLTEMLMRHYGLK
jgi:hypothetical protein